MFNYERKSVTGNEIREKFLQYFVRQGHRRVPSSSLVPAGDATLLFTNAGMNQFKDVFLGLEKRDYTRACSSQKCVRAGGKHNDLENVGFTNRHLTFFEMLGNFSFGDYFKREAIQYAWELVTSKEWFGVSKDKLYVTIFKGEAGVPRDDEANQNWLEVGVPREKIFETGMKDNFWQMGDTGPCGPCSEIHYDMGPAASDLGHGVSAPECKFPCDCGRFVEIWNLVFMQFDRDSNGKLTPLPKPCVDTGMGLERIASVLQGHISVFETDLFRGLSERAYQLCSGKHGIVLHEIGASKFGAASLYVIADHSRATTFLISDGVLPSNEGRGYVLRKIIRRAVRHGRLLAQKELFLHLMVPEVVRTLTQPPDKVPYPELLNGAERIEKIVYEEERRFAHTLDIGLKELDQVLDKSTATGLVHANAVPGIPPGRCSLSGRDAFKLYETYGLPIDFIRDAARDRNVDLNETEFEQAMLEERERAKASWKGRATQSAPGVFQKIAEVGLKGVVTALGMGLTLPNAPSSQSVFEGYERTDSHNCCVIGITRQGQLLAELKPGEEGEIVLDHTPFYAESGGQVGDLGWFYDHGRNNVLAEVKGCFAPVQGVRAHKVLSKQNIRVGDTLDAVVNAAVRTETMRNHTATHLLHAALRETLGKHVKQAGSLVAPNHLRFDFSHFTSVADEELQDIEDLINKEVLRNTKVDVINDVPLDVAINELKAMALFGEKYGDKVRVIKIGDFSVELCGGTHTGATGEIGLVKILHEGSVSSGI
ncbi:MAG: alanine--tRNA ligase, partial [Acidobacteria bacterium]|nr:alanine--tRNA ligase [Acidobacteriota bacterium]